MPSKFTRLIVHWTIKLNSRDLLLCLFNLETSLRVSFPLFDSFVWWLLGDPLELCAILDLLPLALMFFRLSQGPYPVVILKGKQLFFQSMPNWCAWPDRGLFPMLVQSTCQWCSLLSEPRAYGRSFWRCRWAKVRMLNHFQIKCLLLCQ